MKKITLLLVIIFTFLFTNTSWGEWELGSEDVEGRTYYYDKDRVRKSGKYLDVSLLYTSPSPRDGATSRIPSSA